MRDRYASMKDIYWTHRGDFALGENGDLKDTETDAYRALIQTIVDRLQSVPGDWAIHPDKGAGLNSALGKLNTKDNGKDIKTRVSNALLYNGLLKPTDFAVDVLPISDKEIMVVLIVTPPGASQAVFIPLTYDARMNRVTPRLV